ncbi:glycolate oxidase subunit GlcE [Pseudoduganella plicata]|uniref:Glycolate oxidase subunit GlcE n=1 Tax=Pseudoduganella plicata TaxID=321984 RepID=A0AA88C7K1_9BURK|nr:glycolate oxidase subunit GlcE [Pseudoduganella plicata]GGY81058.1 glycolate oxidase subunit GlcE [Pseudoduganella plicata]
MPDTIEQFRDRIQAATAAGTPLRIVGGASKDWYGGPLQGDPLETRAHSGIVDYEPTELVVTVRCGTPLAQLEAQLREHRQMLAFEPPRFDPASTIGGVVASGLSGPRRATAGAIRDFLLGAQLMDGKGELLNFGGQVMKNVAGYDVARLLAGSMGVLGLITQVSLKVLPLPLVETTLRFELDEIAALARMNAWGGQPLPLSATCWVDGALTVRLSGSEPAVAAAARKLGGEPVKDDRAFWTSLRDQTHAFFDTDTLWRLALPPAASALILGGTQLIEWGGAQRWLKVPRAGAADIRRSVAAAGGHATLYRAADKSAGAFQPQAPAIARIQERLQAAFDPAGIFNRGRLY